MRSLGELFAIITLHPAAAAMFGGSYLTFNFDNFNLESLARGERAIKPKPKPKPKPRPPKGGGKRERP